jgi:hypothetical protein
MLCLLVGRKKKKKDKRPGGFFSRARHALLAVLLLWLFGAVKG